jgi:hypothetical protein
LAAATGAYAQPPDSHLSAAAVAAPGRQINLRLVEEPGFNRAEPPNRGVLADTVLGANVRMGISLMTVSRPRVGPEWRIDGRALRSRKPALSFSYRF